MKDIRKPVKEAKIDKWLYIATAVRIYPKTQKTHESHTATNALHIKILKNNLRTWMFLQMGVHFFIANIVWIFNKRKCYFICGNIHFRRLFFKCLMCTPVIPVRVSQFPIDSCKPSDHKKGISIFFFQKRWLKKYTYIFFSSCYTHRESLYCCFFPDLHKDLKKYRLTLKSPNLNFVKLGWQIIRISSAKQHWSKLEPRNEETSSLNLRMTVFSNLQVLS